MAFVNRLFRSFRVGCKLSAFLTVFVLFTLFHLTQIAYLHLYSNFRDSYSGDVDFQNDEFPLLEYHKDIPFRGEKVIHFDFKGAPPKVSYLKDVISLIKSLGATGVLLDFQDAFPYRDGLEGIRALNGYTSSDVVDIVETAENNNLTVIPFVETFSNLEFVLKLEKYKRFREVERYPEALCPNKKDVYVVLFKMIDQVLRMHPRASYIHIGCGWVSLLGMCPKCQKIIKTNKWRKEELYFNHVVKVAKYIKDTYPGVRPIVWGDKMKRKNEETILKHKIPDLVDVMFLNHRSDVSTFPKPEDMKIYGKIFKNIWIAGAFKGATGSTKIVTNPEYHIKNIKAWNKFVSQWKHMINFQGIVLTGWQRYTHFMVLCELLPVALPSLALVLQLLNTKEGFNYDEVKHTLNCSGYVPLSLYNIRDTVRMSRLVCDFPGYNIYKVIHWFYNEVQNHQELMKLLHRGELSFYNLAHKFQSPLYIHELNHEGYKKYLLLLNKMEKKIKTALSEVYDESTVNEWIITHVMPLQFRLEAAVNSIDSLTAQKVWPRRPLTHDPVTIRQFFTQICNPNQTMGCTFFNLH